MANTTNISPIISPDILKAISTSTAIKTFGTQTKDENKETIIIGNQTKTAELDNELDNLDKREEQAGINKDNTIQNALYQLDTNQITQDQYNEIYKQAEISYGAEIDAINIQRKKIDQDKDIIEDDPYTGIKNEQKSLNTSIKKSKKDTQNGDTSYNVEYDDGTKDRIAVSNDANGLIFDSYKSSLFA